LSYQAKQVVLYFLSKVGLHFPATDDAAMSQTKKNVQKSHFGNHESPKLLLYLQALVICGGIFIGSQVDCCDMCTEVVELKVCKSEILASS